MDHVFDQLARVLSSEMPRRRAFKLAGGVLAAGIFGAVTAPRLRAETCKKNETPCAASGKDACCPAGQTCCTTCTNKGPFCNAAPNGKCPASQQVC